MESRTRLVICVVVLAVGGLCVGTATATAAVGDGPIQFSHESADETAVDQHLESGGLYWQGQSLWLEDPNGEVDSEQLLLREYDTSDNDVGSVIRTIEFENNETMLETTDLDGTYVRYFPNAAS